MRLLHYSNRPLENLHNIFIEDQGDFKPSGLWVSIEGDDDWKSWCESEEFGLDRLNFIHEVILFEDANILRLACSSDILEFTKKYQDRTSNFRSKIIWKDVATDFDGIIIAPYIWKLRLDAATIWYYPWDCASGCIWNTSKAIKEIKLLSQGVTV